MADTMVTARMTQQKKEAGNRILKELGTNPSQAVNGLYDFVIREKKLPYQQQEEFGWQKYTKEQIAQARALVNSLVIEDSRFSTMTDDEIRQERLASKGLWQGGER